MSTPPEGSGSVKTYVVGTPAAGYVSADLRLDNRIGPPDDVVSVSLDTQLAGFEMEDYMIVEGEPCGLPNCMVRMNVACNVGAPIATDVPPAPADVATGATLRWLPTDGTFSPDGTFWEPTFGSGLNLLSISPPFLDDLYSYQVRGGFEVEMPAVIFAGDSFMELSSAGWAAPAFTFILVAVMHANPEGPRYGIFESSTTDPDITLVDWGLRYNQGNLELFAGSQLVAAQLNTTPGRPTFFAVSVDAATGRLLVADTTKISKDFSTAGFSLFDFDMLLGATSAGAANETAYMDVLDFSYFDRALGFDELADQLHFMDSIYGIVK